MSDQSNQLDRAMDEIKEEMIKDIIESSDSFQYHELNSHYSEILSFKS